MQTARGFPGPRDLRKRNLLRILFLAFRHLDFRHLVAVGRDFKLALAFGLVIAVHLLELRIA